MMLIEKCVYGEVVCMFPLHMKMIKRFSGVTRKLLSNHVTAKNE
jgi:hypothetical protein